MKTVTENGRRRKNRGAFSVSEDEETEKPSIVAELKIDDKVLKKIIQRETLADVPTEDRLKILDKEKRDLFLEQHSKPQQTPFSAQSAHNESNFGLNEDHTSIAPTTPPTPETAQNTEQYTNKYRTNIEQTPNNIRTNTEQSESPQINLEDSNDERGLNTEQIPNKYRTIYEQIPNNIRTNAELEGIDNRTKGEQRANKVRTKHRTEHRTNIEQTPNNSIVLSADIGRKFHSLVGLRRSVILFIYNSCKSARAKTTDPIALTNLASSIGAARETVEVTIRRLEKEGFLIKTESKLGKGGWTIYELPDSLYQEILHLESAGKLSLNTEQIPNKVRTEHRTEHRTRSSSSSSSNLIDTTTITNQVNSFAQLPIDWQQISLSRIVDLPPKAGLSLNEDDIVDFYNYQTTTAGRVQENIDRIAHDLGKGGTIGSKGMNSPINVLTSLLMKNKMYRCTTPGYESRKPFSTSPKEEVDRLNKINKILSKELDEIKSILGKLMGSEPINSTKDDPEMVTLVEQYFRTMTEDEREVYAARVRKKYPTMKLEKNSSSYTSMIKEEILIDLRDNTPDSLTAEEVRRIADRELGPIS